MFYMCIEWFDYIWYDKIGMSGNVWVSFEDDCFFCVVLFKGKVVGDSV